jgi:ABC-type lipoprotein export system ATPase subunit
MLALRDVAKHYPGGGETVRAVDGVSLDVAAGETVLLYGPSGSGKTTLLMMIAMLLAPSGGRISIGERDVSSLSEREAARFRLAELGFIHQGSELLPGVSTIDNTVLKLIATMRWRDARREVTPLLESLGLGARCRQNPGCCSLTSLRAASTAAAAAKCSRCCAT